MNTNVISEPCFWQKIADVEILRTVGEGPFATVYLARQLSLNRNVALKVFQDRRPESKTTAVFEHDHIVRVYSETADPALGMRFICKQYVPGATIAEILLGLEGKNRAGLTGQDILDLVDSLAVGPTPFNASHAEERLRFSHLPFDEAVAWIGIRVAEALEHAHQRGALHLNIKPGNIVINPYGRPYLADFTLFRQRFGFTGAPPGLDPFAVRYMAPEYRAFLEGESLKAVTTLDERADLYSVGVILSELRGGAPVPDSRKVDAALVPRHAPRDTGSGRLLSSGFVAPPRSTGSTPSSARLARSQNAHLIQCPARRVGVLALPHVELDQILLSCLQKAPEDRWKDAEQLAGRLKGLLEFRLIRQAMPTPGWLMRFSLRVPLTALILARQVPHLVGTGICTAYCLLRRGLTLNAAQRAVMLHLTKLYNSISYPTGIAIVLVLAALLLPAFKRRGREPFEGSFGTARLATLRRRATRLPLWLAGVNTLTWLPSIAFFTYVAYALTGHFRWAGFLHFSSAVLLSWAIATSYSSLYTIFFSVQILYPRFLELVPDIRLRARSELRVPVQFLGCLPYLLAFIPLAAALLLVQQEPGKLCTQRFQSFQLLLMALILGGAAGFLFSLRAIRRLNRVIAALTGAPPLQWGRS